MTPSTPDEQVETTATWLDERLVVPESPCEEGARVRLAGAWCVSCDRAEFPARSSCPRCADEMTRRALSTSGTVMGCTAVLHQPPGASLDAPYGVVAVRHDEGVTVLGPVVGDRWADVELGDRVVVTVIRVGDAFGFGYERETT